MSLTIIEHPIIKVLISKLRDERTSTKEFRITMNKLSRFILYEAMRDLETEEFKVKTPCGTANGYKMKNENIVFVPILRAGLGMVESALEIFPDAKVGHLGLVRDEETLEPSKYYAKLPKNIDESIIFILDPMLATGGSLEFAITYLKNNGAKPNTIRAICTISAPEGVNRIEKSHPDVKIFTSAHDEKLNNKGYIVPGLGDAGDRFFGTG